MDKTNEKMWAIISLASVPLIMTLGNSMFIPMLPILEKELSISKLESSYMITFYSVVAILFIPLAGYLSDWFGRKRVILPALLITAVGGLLSGIAAWKMDNPYMLILIGRILQGIGASGAMPVVLPLVGDIFHRDDEASSTLGIIETANTAGKVLSPILGAALAMIVWYVPFFAIPVFSISSGILIYFFIEKKAEPGKKLVFRQYWQDIRAVFKEHGKWLYAVYTIGAIVMFMLFGFLFYLSSILEDTYDFTGVKKGLLLAIPLFALSAASFLAGKWVQGELKKMKWVTFIGIVIAGCAVSVSTLFEHYIYVIVIFFIAGIGIGIVLPCLDARITENVEKDIRGAVMAFYSSMRFIGVALGPPIIALLMKKSIIWIAILLTALALVAGVLAFKNRKMSNS